MGVMRVIKLLISDANEYILFRFVESIDCGITDGDVIIDKLKDDVTIRICTTSQRYHTITMSLLAEKLQVVATPNEMLDMVIHNWITKND